MIPVSKLRLILFISLYLATGSKGVNRKD
jgi:hypothetical protein